MYKYFSEILQSRGISPYKVSKATGISQQTLSDWKNGKSIPKRDKLQKIADYLNISIDFLTGNFIELNFVPHEFEGIEIKCPICGYDYVGFVKTCGVKFNNSKSSGTGIEFWCEQDHRFYYVFESYKGNTYAVQVDRNAVHEMAELYSINEHKSALVAESQFEKKYRDLDNHGKKVVNLVLDEEYARCQSKIETLKIARSLDNHKSQIVEADDLSKFPESDDDRLE